MASLIAPSEDVTHGADSHKAIYSENKSDLAPSTHDSSAYCGESNLSATSDYATPTGSSEASVEKDSFDDSSLRLAEARRRNFGHYDLTSRPSQRYRYDWNNPGDSTHGHDNEDDNDQDQNGTPLSPGETTHGSPADYFEATPPSQTSRERARLTREALNNDHGTVSSGYVDSIDSVAIPVSQSSPKSLISNTSGRKFKDWSKAGVQRLRHRLFSKDSLNDMGTPNMSDSSSGSFGQQSSQTNVSQDTSPASSTSAVGYEAGFSKSKRSAMILNSGTDEFYTHSVKPLRYGMQASDSRVSFKNYRALGMRDMEGRSGLLYDKRMSTFSMASSIAAIAPLIVLPRADIEEISRPSTPVETDPEIAIMYTSIADYLPENDRPTKHKMEPVDSFSRGYPRIPARSPARLQARVYNPKDLLAQRSPGNSPTDSHNEGWHNGRQSTWAWDVDSRRRKPTAFRPQTVLPARATMYVPYRNMTVMKESEPTFSSYADWDTSTSGRAKPDPRASQLFYQHCNISTPSLQSLKYEPEVMISLAHGKARSKSERSRKLWNRLLKVLRLRT